MRRTTYEERIADLVVAKLEMRLPRLITNALQGNYESKKPRLSDAEIQAMVDEALADLDHPRPKTPQKKRLRL